ncbi:hypothetical protein LTR64_002317 [Lithohypha guttulata]|uniref:uncharacterized protein n=1 Tax=Lithohypha guttulata TaxID=1690604 RepID=UPI002DDFB6C1|nr:hypothetical protein LTR51_001457 [Lithohypha guttulata]
MSEHNDEETDSQQNTEFVDSSRPFRFKKRRDRDEREEPVDVSVESERRRHRHRRHHHSRHKRRKLSNEDISFQPKLPPADAFRESLFDALADDEGADFWQGVYGQPIHQYPRTFADAESGEVETMDDEQKMWEKSAEGIQAAKEVKRREKREEEQQQRQRREQSRVGLETGPPHNNFAPFDFEIEASLKRGQQRKEKKRWQHIWQDYLNRWKILQDLHESSRTSSADDIEQIFLRNKIAWPVESGKRKDLSSDEIEKFFHQVAEVAHADDASHTLSISSILKAERIRWHPDKVQQRYGFMNVDQSTLEGVTAVFQVLDRLWNERRTK